MAGAAEQRAGEERRQRVQREGEHESGKPGHDERQAQRLRAGGAVTARGDQLRGARGGEQRRGDGAEERKVAGVEQLRGVARHDRQVERGDHPHRARGQARAPEAGWDIGWHGGALDRQRPPDGFGSGIVMTATAARTARTRATR